MSAYHVPVMLDEVLEGLQPAPGKRIVDATLGGAGHASEIAKRLGSGGTLIGLDQDPDALAEAARVLESVGLEGVEVRLVRSNFVDMRSAVESVGIDAVDGVLMDLGVSSFQLDTPGRGFSFRLQGPLDMRMDPNSEGPTASDLVNRLSEQEIARILYEYGEERRSRQIAAEICRRRQLRPLATTEDLVEAVRGAMPFRTRPGEIHPATRTFQALRIEVNKEILLLGRAIRDAVTLLRRGGRIAIIAYHSLEDRVVKSAFAELSGKREETDFPLPVPAEPTLRVITRKPLTPTEAEVRRNPRSRSAKLRVAERL